MTLGSSSFRFPCLLPCLLYYSFFDLVIRLLQKLSLIWSLIQFIENMLVAPYSCRLFFVSFTSAKTVIFVCFNRFHLQICTVCLHLNVLSWCIACFKNMIPHSYPKKLQIYFHLYATHWPVYKAESRALDDLALFSTFVLPSVIELSRLLVHQLRPRILNLLIRCQQVSITVSCF